MMSIAPNEQQEFLTVADIAERLHISEDSAYQLCREQTFPALRIGHLIRIPSNAFDRWVARQTEHGEG